MTLRWRELLNHLNIQWTDSSRYAGRNWIAIRCVWCHDDPGFHLGINEDHGGYHCLRGQHSGKSPHYLLRALGVASDQIDRLLADHGGQPSSVREPKILGDPSPFERRWQALTPANAAALEYLYHRGFTDPEGTARRFDLRSGTGKWAGRLWFKLTNTEGRVVGFTGRSVGRLLPRYWTETAEQTLYLPRPPHPRDRLALVVEGPMDALRLAGYPGVLPVALCGLAVTAAKRLRLLALARRVPTVLLTLDRTVPLVERNRLLNELKPINCEPYPLPDGIDDPAELSEKETELWLSQTKGSDGLSSARNGREPSRPTRGPSPPRTTGG